jgi:hypothetical protein
MPSIGQMLFALGFLVSIALMLRLAKKGKRWSATRLIIGVAFLLCAYPAFVLGYTWTHVAMASTSLPGGRHGPLDAYRHTLASAVVAYTLSPRAVYWVTVTMESKPYKSSTMDRHNNRIGATVGTQAKSFAEIQPTVHALVQQGAIETTNADQTTWLPMEYWQDGLLW